MAGGTAENSPKSQSAPSWEINRPRFAVYDRLRACLVRDLTLFKTNQRVVHTNIQNDSRPTGGPPEHPWDIESRGSVGRPDLSAKPNRRSRADLDGKHT
jgi:hypothetical protein